MTDQPTSTTREGRTATEEKAPRGADISPRPAGPVQAHALLPSDRGSTHIADTVVAKVAGLATREIPGVHNMGTGLARTFGALRQRVTRASDEDLATQGVSVEVGERQAAIDIDIVTYYGQSIVEVSQAVRQNVIDRVEGMTGLEVKEVNISIDDLYTDLDDAAGSRSSRVE